MAEATEPASSKINSIVGSGYKKDLKLLKVSNCTIYLFVCFSCGLINAFSYEHVLICVAQPSNMD